MSDWLLVSGMCWVTDGVYKLETKVKILGIVDHERRTEVVNLVATCALNEIYVVWSRLVTATVVHSLNRHRFTAMISNDTIRYDTKWANKHKANLTDFAYYGYFVGLRLRSCLNWDFTVNLRARLCHIKFCEWVYSTLGFIFDLIDFQCSLSHEYADKLVSEFCYNS